MASVPSQPKPPASRNLVLAVLVIAILALGVAAYAFTTLNLRKGPAPQTRTFLLSIDFYNATSGSTIYTSARFTPDTITVFEGDTVVLNVTNRDPRPVTSTAGQHGFTVDGLTSGTTVDPGATITANLPNVKEGVYRYYCQLHTAHLSGQLIVEGQD